MQIRSRNLQHKKIAFLTASVNRGGASKVISILANHYSKKGWEVDFLIKEDIINGYELDKNVNIVEFKKLNKKPQLSLPIRNKELP